MSAGRNKNSRCRVRKGQRAKALIRKKARKIEVRARRKEKRAVNKQMKEKGKMKSLFS
jgi:hypothetical protein